MLGRIERVWFWVSDMDRALKFYTEVLGLPLVHRHGDEWAELGTEPVHLALHGGGEGYEPGGTVCLEVEDLDEARFSLELRGVVFDRDAGEVEGVARFVSFADPDGNRLQLIERYGEH